MKNIRFIVIAVALLTVSLEIAYARHQSSVDLGVPVMNPVRSHSSMSTTRTVRNPSYDSIGRSGNLTVYGNVTGERYFRGVVPYRAPYQFGDSLGSSELGSFLRRSAGGFGSDRSPGRTRPYYLPSQTVTSFRRGWGSGLQRPSIRKTGGTGGFIPLPLSETTATTPQARWNAYTPEFRPLSRRLDELDKLISRQLREFEETREVREQARKKRLEKFQQDLAELEQKAGKIEERLIDKTLQPAKPEKPGQDITKPVEPAKPFDKGEQQRPENVYRQMLELLQQEFKKTLAEESAKQAELEKQSKEDHDKSTLAGEDKQDIETTTRYGLKSRTGSVLLRLYKSFAGTEKNKFNEYIELAEDYMRQGKFYLAADSYTLANICEPDNPLAYIGKAHALLAAGEYMSSAFFLSKAIEMFPDYTRFKVDLVAMLGDRDKLESRIADVLEWYEISGAGELEFLLAYVYYQTDRLGQAEQFINSAYEKMSDSVAVAVLKQTITDALTASQ